MEKLAFELSFKRFGRTMAIEDAYLKGNHSCLRHSSGLEVEKCLCV